MILDASDALKAEEIGPTSAEAVQSKIEHKQFIDSLEKSVSLGRSQPPSLFTTSGFVENNRQVEVTQLGRSETPRQAEDTQLQASRRHPTLRGPWAPRK